MLAMVFPGQGSQSVGMQAALAQAREEVRRTWAEAGETLGYDLAGIAREGPREKLDETVVTQPAMLTAGVAAWRAWVAAGGASPMRMAGHSLGEYSALVCAGALEFTAALRLVERRAELMQDAVPAGEGAMAAILGLDDEAVVALCDAAAEDEVLSAVNFNAPGQVVIAGSAAAVERAIAGAKSAGAKRAMKLSVSVPSHCALMQPAAGELAGALAETVFVAPTIPVISNVDVRAYTTAEEIRDGLARQLYSPVRWTETLHNLVAAGSNAIVECGPGRVLSGLTRRVDRSVGNACIDTPDDLDRALETVDGVSR